MWSGSSFSNFIPFHCQVGASRRSSGSRTLWNLWVWGGSVFLATEWNQDILIITLAYFQGILFTGGGQDLDASNPYVITARAFYELSLKKGNYFPIWGLLISWSCWFWRVGTCEGFQLLNILTGGINVLQTGFDSEDICLPLQLISDPKDSRFFSNLSSFAVETLTTKNSTINFHHDGVWQKQITHFLKVRLPPRPTNRTRNWILFIASRQSMLIGKVVYSYPR